MRIGKVIYILCTLLFLNTLSHVKKCKCRTHFKNLLCFFSEKVKCCESTKAFFQCFEENLDFNVLEGRYLPKLCYFISFSRQKFDCVSIMFPKRTWARGGGGGGRHPPYNHPTLDHPKKYESCQMNDTT